MGAGDDVPFQPKESGAPLYSLGASGAVPCQAKGSGDATSADPIGPPIPMKPKRVVTPEDFGDIASLYGVEGNAAFCAGWGVGPGVPQQPDPLFGVLSGK